MHWMQLVIDLKNGLLKSSCCEGQSIKVAGSGLINDRAVFIMTIAKGSNFLQVMNDNSSYVHACAPQIGYDCIQIIGVLSNFFCHRQLLLFMRLRRREERQIKVISERALWTTLMHTTLSRLITSLKVNDLEVLKQQNITALDKSQATERHCHWPIRSRQGEDMQALYRSWSRGIAIRQSQGNCACGPKPWQVDDGLLTIFTIPHYYSRVGDPHPPPPENSWSATAVHSTQMVKCQLILKKIFCFLIRSIIEPPACATPRKPLNF